MTPAGTYRPGDHPSVAGTVPPVYRRRLRFTFAAASLRAAVDLADALRRGTSNHVQVRPSAGRLLSSQLWDVIVTTRPALSLSAVARLWTDEMLHTAADHPGCELIGWKPIVTREG